MTLTPTDDALARRRSLEDALDDLMRLGVEDAGELLLICHAEPARTQGHDPMLSCTGLIQAERLAERLSHTSLDAVYTAPERRAQQTARVIAGPNGHTLHVLDTLADVEYDGSMGASDATTSEALQRFAEVPRWDSLPGYESSARFRRRAVQAIESVLARHPARRVAVVTHAAVINAYLSMLLCVPADLFFMPEPASLSILRWREGQYALRSLNDLSHLSLGAPISGESDLFTVRSLPLTSR